jgi:hypothetical protein
VRQGAFLPGGGVDQHPEHGRSAAEVRHPVLGDGGVDVLSRHLGGKMEDLDLESGANDGVRNVATVNGRTHYR